MMIPADWLDRLRQALYYANGLEITRECMTPDWYVRTVLGRLGVDLTQPISADVPDPKGLVKAIICYAQAQQPTSLQEMNTGGGTGGFEAPAGHVTALTEDKDPQALDTFTHDDQEYDLAKVKALLKDAPVRDKPVANLIWILKGASLDEDAETELQRLETADVTNPILVTRWHNKWVVLDGAHRLKVANMAQLETLPAKEITTRQLLSCRID